MASRVAMVSVFHWVFAELWELLDRSKRTAQMTKGHSLQCALGNSLQLLWRLFFGLEGPGVMLPNQRA